MSRSICILLLALVEACASSVLASAQALPSQTDSKNPAQNISPPVALVYVSAATGATNEINAYVAHANGTMTPVAGSPFAGNGAYLAANRGWLFSTDTVNIYSYSIAADGALTQASSINAQQYNQYPTGGPISLFFDRTGTTLYDEDIYWDGANNNYQSFDLNPQSGTLTYLGATNSVSAAWITPLTFIANNKDAYGSTCLKGSQYIYGFSRSSNGTLTDMNITPAIPTAPQGGYCPYLAAADAANDVAISLTPTDDGYSPIGPAQIGVYTADSSGDLTTNSTSANMPPTAVGTVIDMKASPSGKLLAIAGTTGLQVFHFNGPNPATHFTGLITNDEVDQIFWDNANHLYAVSRSTGQLFVFNVDSKSCVPAQGSPYSIPNAENIAVLSRM
jgi:hypothetical protein